MKLIPKSSWRVLIIAVLLALTAPLASAKNLAVNLVLQRTKDANDNPIGDNWCWAACSKMILDYYGYPQAIEDIVTYGIGSSTYDTWNYSGSSGSEARDDVGVWEAKAGGGYELKMKTIDPLTWNGNTTIVKHFSNDEVGTQSFSVGLASARIKEEINDRDAPMIRRIGWDGTTSGHFTVVYGVADSGDLSVHDPWFGDYVASDALIHHGSIDGSTFTWTHTMTTSKIIDVLFLVDTTGSMGSYISAARSSASSLLDKIATKFKNYRVAVADYKDFPDDESNHLGGPNDYVYRGIQTFTSDKATAQGGINRIPAADGGDDTPESVFSALYNGLRGNEIGVWREDPCKRVIILIGDAEGHNPEPWRGGHSFAEIARIATNPDFPISIQALWAGTSVKAGNQYKSIAGSSGGTVVQSSSSSGTGAGLGAIIDSISANPRLPKGVTPIIKPTYSFGPLDVGFGGMAADSTKTYLEIQKFDAATSSYIPLQVVKIKKNNTVYLPKKPYPLGDYRWRLGFKRPGGTLFLPSLGKTDPPTTSTIEDPLHHSASQELVTIDPTVTYEASFVEFSRTAAPPEKPGKLNPSGSFTSGAKAITFRFTSVPNATSYVLEVLQGTDVFKRAKVKAPKNDPGSVVLTKRISGFTIDSSYSWQVQGLNYDRPEVDPTAW